MDINSFSLGELRELMLACDKSSLSELFEAASVEDPTPDSLQVVAHLVWFDLRRKNPAISLSYVEAMTVEEMAAHMRGDEEPEITDPTDAASDGSGDSPERLLGLAAATN